MSIHQWYYCSKCMTSFADYQQYIIHGQNCANEHNFQQPSSRPNWGQLEQLRFELNELRERLCKLEHAALAVGNEDK